jgi:hypothetical protein
MNLNKITSFGEISNGDSLLVKGNIGGVESHVFKRVSKKETVQDGQEVILRSKGNMYFNFGMYLEGKSWVKECYNLSNA